VSEPNQPSSPTADIAEFAAGCALADIPGSVVTLAKKSILDALGVGLAGAADEGAAILRNYVESFGGAGAASLLGTAVAAPPALAALSNGMAMHMDDYDDTLRSSVIDLDKGSIHPTAGILSAVLALGQAKGCSGEALLTAYLVGVEAAGKIADALGPRHFRAGFHGTATCVGLGAAVAGARLLGLPAGGLATALGIAASGSAGLRENFGTMVKPYHAGQAAETGVMAAELVETSRLYARTVATVKPEWIEKAAGHLVKKGYSEPHWERDRGQVAAYLRINLFGLTLIPRRKVNYGPIDPEVSREIFIRSALVDGDFKTRAPFWKRELGDNGAHWVDARNTDNKRAVRWQQDGG